MRRNLLIRLGSALVLSFTIAGSALAGVSVGVSADEDGLKSFYFAIGDHYRVPEKEVVVVQERHVPDDELPVVFHIAKRAGISSVKIIDLRLDGMSWMDITLRLGLTAEIFYVPVEKQPGPPYGNAWGHFKNGKKTGWKEVRLSDPDIVNWVNLSFMSKEWGMTPEEVIKLRSDGSSFVKVNQKIKQNRKQQQDEKMASQQGESGGKGNGNGNGNGKGKNK